MKGLARWMALGVAALLGVVVVRTWTFGSNVKTNRPIVAVPIDTAAAVTRLASSLRIRTISWADRGPDTLAFTRLHQALESSFPTVHSVTARETVGGLSLLYSWPGSDPTLDPVLLAAHLDVVPADDSTLWTHPPFSGTVINGSVWGRGALDDRSGVFALLEAAEMLSREGYVPRRTLLFAFGHDEELGGASGAAKIAELLRARDIQPVVAVDEGGVVSHRMIPGVTRPVAVVGTAEKGGATLKLTARAEGGHSSIPKAPSAIGRLTRAVSALESAPIPARFTAPTWGLFEAVAPHMPFTTRAVFANRWLTQPVLLSLLSGSPTTNAAVRTTTAPTVIAGGDKENVLPAEAHALVNFRLLPGASPASVRDHAVRVIDDPEIEVSIEPGAKEASRVSDPAAPAYGWLADAIESRFEHVVVAPFLFVGGTDGRHYEGIAQNVYRFLPIEISPDAPLLFHAVDERISVSGYAQMIGFYYQLLSTVDQVEASSSENFDPGGGR